MIVNNIFSRILFGILASCCLLACRGELPVLPSDEIEVGKDPLGGVHIKGMYLLNEGNMGSNKCTLDFYDSTTGKYHRNIYAERNPSVVKELGDVGNDLQIYGDKLYAVINCSNFIEVMDVETAQHLGQIDVVNCRYITFSNGKAYVSSYAGPVGIDPNARPGKVVEVDTTNLAITREVVVGYQPEEMVIKDGKLYVANIGDSRLYVINRDIRQITRDHSLVAEMVRIGEVNEADARIHPDKNIITRAIGAGEDVQADFFEVDLQENDRILLCTDGLTNMVEDDKIRDIILSDAPLEERAKLLVSTANRNGGRDNITVMIIEPFSYEVKAC